MAVTETQIRYYKSANHPANDTDVAGGPIRSPLSEITVTEIGACLPKLLVSSVGELDTDAEVQYQVGYWRNSSGIDTFHTPSVYVANFLEQPQFQDGISFISNSAADGSSKKAVIYGSSGPGLLIEEVYLDGLAPAISYNSYDRIHRIVLQSASNNAPINAAGTINIQRYDGFTTQQDLGIIPAGYNTATAEFWVAPAPANGDVATWPNRKTEPSGLTWAQPRAIFEAVSLPAALGPGERCALYWKQILQPGLPTWDIRLDLRIRGEV